MSKRHIVRVANMSHNSHVMILQVLLKIHHSQTIDLHNIDIDLGAHDEYH
jgi:hypothetical protein